MDNHLKHSWRYEIKYVIDIRDFDALRKMIAHHPASFSKAFPDRRVNNIYLDTLDFVKVRENLAGISDRDKYRIRWYGNDHIEAEKTLEQKIKKNSLGRKNHYKLGKSFELPKSANAQFLKLTPTLQNSYNRSYFLDLSNKFRLTIDTQISYLMPQSNLPNPGFSDYENYAIMEMKFDQSDFQYFEEIEKHISFRVSKNSKYVNGVMKLYA